MAVFTIKMRSEIVSKISSKNTSAELVAFDDKRTLGSFCVGRTFLALLVNSRDSISSPSPQALYKPVPLPAILRKIFDVISLGI